MTEGGAGARILMTGIMGRESNSNKGHATKPISARTFCGAGQVRATAPR